VEARQAFGRSFLSVDPEALTLLSRAAFRDIAHLLRPSHLKQLRSILDDPEASPNDRYVARDLLQNANIAVGGILPMCQDTGTAIVTGKCRQVRVGAVPGHAADSRIPPHQRVQGPRARAGVLEITRKIGIGAQFGGKYFCHDVRVIRLRRPGPHPAPSWAVRPSRRVVGPGTYLWASPGGEAG
jgi:tartrate dehydratase alpha subunit/fumarate hydratase class I-like protein